MDRQRQGNDAGCGGGSDNPRGCAWSGRSSALAGPSALLGCGISSLSVSLLNRFPGPPSFLGRTLGPGLFLRSSALILLSVCASR